MLVVGVIEIDEFMKFGGDSEDSLAPDLPFGTGLCEKEISSGGDDFFGVPSSVLETFCLGLFASVCDNFRFNKEPPGCGVMVSESLGLLLGFVAGMIEISERFPPCTGDFDEMLSYERKRFLTDSEYDIAELEAEGESTKSPLR